jgi:hypothetical protein
VPTAPKRAPEEYQFQKGHKKRGGRARGEPNVVTRTIRESVVEGINRAGGGGPEGVVQYAEQAARKDYRYGIAMLQLVVPKAIEATVRHEEQVLLTVEDLDESLRQAGLPPTKEIFALDYRGDPAESVQDIAETSSEHGDKPLE